MFEHDLKNTVISASLALAAFGFATENQAEATVPLQSEPQSASSVQLVEESFPSRLRSAPSGALEGYGLPVYDGAVRWVDFSEAEAKTLMAGLAAAAAGVMIGGSTVGERALHHLVYGRQKSGVSLAMTGALLGAGILGSLGAAFTYGAVQPDPDKSVSFYTSVSEIHGNLMGEATGQSHHGSARFFQLISIPELPVPLMVDQMKTPFIEGQEIRATFYFDSQGNINSWQAESGTR